MDLPISNDGAAVEVFVIKKIQSVSVGVFDLAGVNCIMFDADQVLTIDSATAIWPKDRPVAFAPGAVVSLGTACNAFIM